LSQVAVTLILVSAASLFTATLRNLTRVDGGYDTDRMLLMSIESRSTPYERTGLAPVQDDMLRRVGNVPGVRVVALSSRIPLFGGSNWYVRVRVPEYDVPGDTIWVATNLIAGSYLDASGIRLASGRDFTPGDVASGEGVVIVSAAFVQRYYGDRDPLQRSMTVWLTQDESRSFRIVGVARDAKYGSLRETPEPLIYLPATQVPIAHAGTMLARTTGDPLRVSSAVSKAIEAAAPGIIIRRVQDMEQERDYALTLERLAARLATFVSAMALLLSVVGLYGVVAYSIARRMSEIGIRIALGARGRAVLWLVAKETIALVGVGVLVGIPLSFAANGALRSALFGVGAFDPTAATVAVLLLATAGLAASVVPARRAVRVDPRLALNAE
jgi:predicted permease